MLLVVMLLTLQWREIQVRYHIWRLEQANTLEEVRPWFETLAQDSSEPGMSESIARKLGPGHQKFTFWFFRIFPHEHDNGLLQNDEAHKKLHPLMREVWKRLETDESLLACWVHFLRWQNIKQVREGLFEFQRPSEDSLRPVFVGIEIDIAYESSFKWSFFEYVGTLWLLGMEDRPKCIDFDPQVDPQLPWEYFTGLQERLYGWIQGHRDGFRFDPELGRFCPQRSQSAPSVAVPVPTIPFPDWSGPIPSTPELPIRLR